LSTDDLNKYVELHAYATYSEFLKSHGEELKLLPAPQIAKDYYGEQDAYMFDAFQSSLVLGARESEATLPRRRPTIETLYDVFVNIRDDELEHAQTMEKLEMDIAVTSRGKYEGMGENK
jgi:ubiquinol oxidase